MRKNILLTITAIILASCGQNQTANSPENIAEASSNTLTLSTDQLRAADVKLGHVERQMIGTSLHVNGMLDVPPQNLITIAAPMGGFVKSTKLLQGMKVKKGELLATLESQEYIQLQQDYLDHKSKLEFLESEYERQLELAKENVNARKTVQQAKSQYQSAEAIVKGLEAKLGMINISPSALAQDKIRSTINLYAPLNGYVTVINVNIGQYVNAADEIFKIVNLEHLHAELQVFERDIHSLRIGQKVTFKLANENNIRTATVHLIGKEIGPERTVRVHCHLDKEDENLLPGMYITASIERDPREVDALPANAIVTYEGSDFVFVQNGGNKFTMTKVKTGTSAGDTVEVQFLDTFDRNSAIVTDGAFDLLGMLKNTKEDE